MPTTLFITPSFQKDRLALKKAHQINHRKLCEILIALESDDAISTRLRAESRIPHCVKYELPDGYRAVFQRVEGSQALLALAVGSHDRVDAFLDGHRGWIFDPKTGAVRELRMATVEDRRVDIVPSTEARPSQLDRTDTGSIAPPRARVFADFSDGMIEALGVPSDLVEAVGLVEEPNALDFMHLLERVGETSQAAADLLASYATGDTETRVGVVAIAKGERELKTDLSGVDARTLKANTDEFIAFEDPKELAEVLESGRFEDWQLFLHPDQRRLVTRRFEGSARIRGISGSGKTVVALHRARHLALSMPPGHGRILFTTFNKALAQSASRLLDSLCGNERDRIHVTHVHRWCLDFISFRGLQRPRFSPDGIGEARRLALATASAVSPELITLGEYVWDEIDFIMGRFLHEDRTEYLDTDRAGRGRALSTDLRGAVLKLYESYVAHLAALDEADPAEFVRIAYRLRRAHEEPEHTYAGVIVDEVQDISELGLRLLHSLVGGRPDGLLLVGDGTQRIFTRGFSLRGLGIDISGRSLVLRKNYRNTRQILEAAFPLVMDAWRGEQEASGDPAASNPLFSAREGPRPAVVHCRTVADEERFLKKEVLYLLGTQRYSPREICVMARNDAIRRRALETLAAAGIPAFHYQAQDVEAGDADKVRVSSLHAAKGHEYSAVFIPGMVEGVFPSRAIEPVEGLAAERAVLYVGMTRARDILYLSHAQNGERGPLEESRFLTEIANSCDQLVYP